MDIWKAITEMRTCTERGDSFSFSFMSFSYERKKSDGVVRIERAKLRRQSRNETNRFSDYMMNFINLDTLEYGSCWQPLLLEFNGEELELTNG